MAYELTVAAEDDVIAIFADSAADFGMVQAERCHAGLVKVFDFLAENPLAARLRPEFSPPVRIHPYESHIVIYVTNAADITIIRVRHGREDWSR